MSIQQQLSRFRSDLERLKFTTRGGTSVRGVCSIRDLSTGESILSAPSALHLSAESLKREKDDIVRSALLHVLGVDEDDADDDALAICLQILIGVCREEIKKQQQGEESGLNVVDFEDNDDPLHWFSLFIHSLPPPSDFHLLPLLWPSHHLDALLDFSIADSVNEKREWLRTKYNTLLVRLDEPSSLSSHVLSTLKQILSWELFLWAACCVQSRCFISADHVLGVALIPFADLFNHNGADCNLSDTFVEERGVGVGGGGGGGGGKKRTRAFSFTLSARCDIKRGEELTISYGDRSGKDLLETFGFLPPVQRNQADAISMPVRSLIETLSPSPLSSSSPPPISSSLSPAIYSKDENHLTSYSTLLSELKESLDLDGGIELCAGPLADEGINENAEEDADVNATYDDITAIEQAWDFSGPSDDTSQLFRVLAWENSTISSSSSSNDIIDSAPPPPPPLERFRRPISRENEIKSMEILTHQIGVYLATLLKRSKSVRIDEDELTRMTAKDLALFVTQVLVDEENRATDTELAFVANRNERDGSNSVNIDKEEEIPIMKSLPLPCRDLLRTSLLFKKDAEVNDEKEIARLRDLTASLYKRNRLRILLVHLQHIARLFDIANGVTRQPVTPGARLLIISARQRAARRRFFKNNLSSSSSSPPPPPSSLKFEFDQVSLSNDSITVLLETRRRDAEMLRSSSSSSSSSLSVADSTGLVNWPSARLLANLLVMRPRLVLRSSNVLELGCGAALSTSAIAAFLTQITDNDSNKSVQTDAINDDSSNTDSLNKCINIVASDGCIDVLPLAQRNLNANNKSLRTLSIHGTQLVKTYAKLLRWGNKEDEEQCLQHTNGQSSFHLIVASECFYLQHGVSQDETGRGGVFTQALEFFNTSRRLLSPCTCSCTSSSSSSSSSTTTSCAASSQNLPSCTAGVLLVIYAPRYRGMGPQIKSASSEAGLLCLSLSTVGLLSEREKSLHLCNDSRLLLLSTCPLSAESAMNDLGTSQGEPGFDDDHYPEWESSTLPPL